MIDKAQFMIEGGRALGLIKRRLKEFVVVGTSYEMIEEFVQQQIMVHKMKPSFSTVANYHWASCVMKNDALCHGIPKNDKVQRGDIISIDLGLINQGYHLDTSITFGLEPLTAFKKHFLMDGEETLKKAISIVRPGVSVYDISNTIEKNLQRKGLGAVYQLTGHGIGKNLHEAPAIPCVAVKSDKKHKLAVGQTLAIEVMYTAQKPDLIVDKDGWTYRTADGSLSGMFEETVMITDSGVKILTI